MVFRNEAGAEATISLADPKDALTLAEVQTVMQDIIVKNIFTTKGGDLLDVVEARIRVLDVTQLA
jgi:hypothetical protein